MVKGKVILAGYAIENNKKWYCNNVEGNEARCCDTYSEKGEHIQRIARYALTGEEDWQYNPFSKCYYYHAYDKYYDEIDGGKKDPMMCTHFRWTDNIESTPLYMFSGGNKNEIQFNYDNGVGGVDNFVKWLKESAAKNKPVELYYVLMYPYYFEPSTHKRTTVKIMEGIMESLKNFEKS